jgi:acyloxyacyl hydrolase
MSSPCFGWMNSDASWRNATTQRAMELNQVYKEIVANNTFKNFEMHYFDCPLEQVVSEWIAKGGEAWQLIEPVDGFHPNQFSDELSVSVMWNVLQEQGLLPPVNPYNSQIEQIFGNQGGYAPEQ